MEPNRHVELPRSLTCKSITSEVYFRWLLRPFFWGGGWIDSVYRGFTDQSFQLLLATASHIRFAVSAIIPLSGSYSSFPSHPIYIYPSSSLFPPNLPMAASGMLPLSPPLRILLTKIILADHEPQSSTLTIVFDSLMLAAMTISLIALAPAIFSKRVARLKTWFSLLICNVIYCLVHVLLIGRQGETQPGRILCVTQACMIYAAPPLLSGAALIFAVEVSMQKRGFYLVHL
jgi:hypothetical protein